MAQDHNDIYTIVEKLAILEGRITPTAVKKGLNPQQRSVPQMPALFRPKTQKILGGDPNAKNPMSGYMVGSDESVENDQAVLEAEMAEDVLEKVKKSFTDFIKQAQEEIKDSDIKDKKQEDTDLKKKDAKDRGLKAKDHPVTTDPDDDQEDLPSDKRQVESAPVKTMTTECGVYEMHGNERDGFEIRRGARAMPSRFPNLAQAEMAIEMFVARKKKQNESQDYLDEE